MADKPNPFLKLLNQVKADAAKTATPKVEEKNIPDSPKKDLTNPFISGKVVSPPTQEKTSLPQVTPQAQQLLGAGVGETTQSESTDLVPYDTHELANINTESMEPVEKRETNLNVKAKQFGQKLQLESTQSVRELCDTLDAMMESENAATLQGPKLIDIRNYVQTLMITLKARPEFDSVIIDKDVRNVMKFIRATREEALALREVKVVKKATRSAKKETTSVKNKGFEDAFKNIMFGAPNLGGK